MESIKITNVDVYENENFDEWVNKKGLVNKCEEYFLNKYIVNKKYTILEAGTGGGRISFHLEQQGFSKISAFDIVPKMILSAKKKKEEIDSKVNFQVENATDLSNFKNSSFNYLIYLQQILNFIEDEDDFNKALKEAFRL